MQMEGGEWEEGCKCHQSLVNDLQLECARGLHEDLLLPVLMYGSETMQWREKERSRVSSVQMDNLKGLLGIRRMDSPECADKGVMRSEEGSI